MGWKIFSEEWPISHQFIKWYNVIFSLWLRVGMNLSLGALQCPQDWSGYSHTKYSQAAFQNFFLGSVSSCIPRLLISFSPCCCFCMVFPSLTPQTSCELWDGKLREYCWYCMQNKNQWARNKAPGCVWELKLIGLQFRSENHWCDLGQQSLRTLVLLL